MTDETKEVISVMKDMFDVLNGKIGTLNGKMDDMQKDITGLKQDVSTLKQDMSDVKERLTNVENKVTNIELTLENETNPRIRALYDGYIANSEKLDKIEPVVDDVKAIKTKTDIIEFAVKSHFHDINRFKRVK